MNHRPLLKGKEKVWSSLTTNAEESKGYYNGIGQAVMKYDVRRLRQRLVGGLLTEENPVFGKPMVLSLIHI